MIVHQPATASESEPLPPRYRENDTINLQDFFCENVEIALGQEVVRHWVFKNCGVLGPAVLFVQEPNNPTNFIECRWTEGHEAFSIKRPEEYLGEERLVGLHHVKFIGCRFTKIEMLVSQETYDRYERGEHTL
jgi:hypothetical protein